MGTPLVAAGLGMAAAYYLCCLWANPAAFLLCMLAACVTASAAISCFSPAPFHKGFSTRLICLCLACGLSAGALVYRREVQAKEALFWGFAEKRIAGFSCCVQSDSSPGKNGAVLAQVTITGIWDIAGNYAKTENRVLAFFREEAKNLSPPPGYTAGGRGNLSGAAGRPPGLRFFQGQTLRISGSLSRGENGELFLFVRSVRVETEPSAFFTLRKNMLLKIESVITSFEIRPFRSAWPGLFAALLLGNQQYLDTQLADRFRQAGTVHILALSGMHLGLLALLVQLLLRPFFHGRAADCIVLVMVGVYLWLAGPRPSLVRAAIMFALYIILSLCDRKPGLLVLLAFTFIVSAVIFPEDLRSLSFILSYLAMLGILLGTAPIKRFVMRWMPGAIATPFAISVAAQAAVSPVLLARFGLLYPGGIPASMALGPLVTVFMWTGILACISTALPFAHPASWVLSFAMKFLYAAIGFVVDICAHIPPIAP